MSRKKNPDVSWWVDDKKKPIGYSTIADSDSIVEMNWPNKTPKKLLEYISENRFIVSPDVIKLLETYIEKGYGDKLLKTRNPNED